jgi:hypothetical protein
MHAAARRGPRQDSPTVYGHRHEAGGFGVLRRERFLRVRGGLLLQLFG